MYSSKKGLSVQISPKKLDALNQLSIPGIKLSDGYDYILLEYALPESTLDNARKRLSSIKTSLSEEIIKDRNR